MNKYNSIISFFLVLSTPFLSLGQNFVSSSALSQGQLYKFQVENEGVYTLTYDFLSQVDGLNVDAISASNFRILVNGGGTVPRSNSAPRVDDWVERPFIGSGLEDGSFNPGDFITFYVEGPHDMVSASSALRQMSNPFSFYDYFILQIDGGSPGSELEIFQNPTQATQTVDSLRAFIHWEQERINLQDFANSYHGSGKTWYGDPFTISRTKNYEDVLNPAEGIDGRFPVQLSFGFASRAGNGADLRLTVNGDSRSYRFGSNNLGNPEAVVARSIETVESFNISSLNEVKLEYLNRTSIDEAWLDYIAMSYGLGRISAEVPTIAYTGAVYDESTEFKIPSSEDDILCLNITNPKDIYGLNTSIQNSILSFSDRGHNEIQKYLFLNPSKIYDQPIFVERIENQNLHGIETPECLVVYHPDFEAAVDRWIAHRSAHSGIRIQKANVFDIYNEFSGAAQDPGAIRDFCRMLFERQEGFEWLLLFGDGSFDYRHINKTHPFASFVPAYETDNSLNPITSFPTDDFFALLNQTEGGNLVGALDISVGRFPVSTLEEAEIMVEKVIRYETNPEAYGDWRLKQVFMADDEDSNIHLRDADDIAEQVGKDSTFNLSKIYFDAFKQVSGAGGIRIPDAQNKINEEIFKGTLIVNYLGHGGPFGMAQERVLENSQIQSWTNEHRLPLFVTATCTFAPYDDPSLSSSGEILVKKENGGSIALFTTVRPVYSSSNRRLTEAAFEQIFKKQNGHYQTLGEVLKSAKNSNSSDTLSINARKFALLGDPTLKLAIPELQIITTSINNNNAQIDIDTLGPLQTATVSGYIADELGDIITDFNGTLYPTLYDKEQQRFTLGQDQGSRVRGFRTQENILWKGKVRVTNGEFSFSFVLPKSIDPEYGNGKMSYYAHNSARTIDAAGAYDKLIIGGLPADTILEDMPPQIALYLDNRSFENGDEVGPQNILLADLSDDIGINLSSNSLGQQIVAFLDGRRDQSFILNNFFEPSEDDFRAGTISYPLQELEPGEHTLTLRAWDVNQNFAEAEIYFTVIESEEPTTFDLQAYPNPFDVSTCISFKTNLPPGNYKSSLEVFDVAGRLVDEVPLNTSIMGSTANCVEWAPGGVHNTLMPGLYFCRLKIIDTSNNVSIRTAVKKLIYTQAQ